VDPTLLDRGQAAERVSSVAGGVLGLALQANLPGLDDLR